MGWISEAYIFIIGNKYWHALAIILLAIILSELLMLFFKKVVERIAKKTRTKEDNKIVMRIESPIIILVLLVGVELALRRMIDSVNFFGNLVNTAIVFVVTYIFARVIGVVLEYWRQNKTHDKARDSRFHEEVVPLMKSLSNILLALIATMVTLQLWGVQVGALLASVGVIGVILGFAFQDTMKNIFGGIALISDDSLRQHDVIKLETGEVGEIVEMSLRAVKIKTYDNDYVLVPNGILANSLFINYAQPTHTIRILVPISVAYGSDVAKVREVLLSVLRNRTDILKYPKREVRFMKMGDYALEFDFLFYINDYRNKFIMMDQITTLAYNALQDADIEIPFPTRTVYQSKQKKVRKHVSQSTKRTPTKKKPARSSKKKVLVKKNMKKNSKKNHSKKRVLKK